MKEKIIKNFTNPVQIGILVNDAAKMMERMGEVLGWENFRVGEFPPETKEELIREYRGKAGNFKAKFCFIDLGNIELELIEPISGENIWSDFIAKHGSCIHHIKFLVDDFNRAEEYFKQEGMRVIQKGSSVGINAGKIWAFLDTFDDFGFELEIMTRNPISK